MFSIEKVLEFVSPFFEKEKKRIVCYVSLIALLIGNVSFAQESPFENMSDSDLEALKVEKCHTTLKAYEQFKDMDASQRQQLRRNEAQLSLDVSNHIIGSRMKGKSATKAASQLVIPLDPDVDPNYAVNPEYTIPVVFHVIHDGDQDGILSVTQAKKVLRIANEDLNGLSEFRSSIQDQFKSDEAHLGIRLVLAQKDPSGNPTNGVTYDTYSGTYATGQNAGASFKSSTKWPTNKYLNIWVVNGQSTYYFTDDDKPSGGSAYAFGPASDNGLTANGTYTGITMAYWLGGDKVNATLDYQALRHVFVHEFGHWLGLNHSWGKGTASGKSSNCNIDDGVADTPNTVGQQYKGKDFENCSYTFASCGVETNVHDFMNYTPCTSMFTNGQKEVMIGSLNSSVAGRSNIITQENLNATLYVTNPGAPRLVVSSEFGTKSNIFREVRDVETGLIENKANIYLENTSFSPGLVGTTLTNAQHYQVANVPAGLSPEIKVTSTTTAEFRLIGNANQHETSNSITNLTLGFNDATFDNATAASIENTSNIAFSVSFRGKIGSPWAPLDYELLYNNSYGLKYGFYERRRTKFTYGNSILEFKFESDELYVRLATPSGDTGIVLENNGSNPGVDQVSVLQYGDVVSQNSNWSVSNADADAEKGWKRVISHNQADISNYLNKDLYFGTYLQYGGRTFYQWIGFTLFETEYNKLAVRLTDLAYGANPDESISCGKGVYDGDSWMVRDLFFMDESKANDGTLYTKSMNFYLRGNTFKSTLSPSDYTVENLPAGLTITSVQSVNNGRKLKFNLGGTYTNPDAGRVNTDITLKASAFTDASNIGASLTKEHQFQFYTNKTGYIVKSVNKTVDIDNDSYTVVGNIKFQYKVDYTKAIPEGRIIVNGRTSGQSVKYSSRFMPDTPGTNNAKLLGAGVMLDENAGLTFPVDLTDDIVVYDKDYTKMAGKEGYLGFQYAIGSFRHYVWIKIKVAANGESVEVLDYALNRIIDTPIMTGELPPPTCDDGIQNGDETNVDCGGSSCQECQYCTASGGGTTLNITQVSFGNINNSTTGNNTYVDYTNISTTVEKGGQIPLTLDTNNSWSPNNIAVWIDWNNDKDFDDEGEKIYSKIGERPYTTSVTVPANAASGASIRMRVRLAYGDNKTTTPCGVDTGIGEVEDYTINIGGTPNVAPTTSITSPAVNAQFTTGNAITIQASATDSDGTIAKVEFFNGATKLGEDITSPYSYVWNNAGTGNHNITVKTTDNEGAVTESSAVAITVNTTPNVAPTASITSPVTNAEFEEGTTITIEASAADSDGTITKVEFFDGATKLGEDTTAPYSYAWNTATTGNHNLTVKATDNESVITESSAVSITVNEVIIVLPEYCTAKGNNGVEGISKVTFAGIDNTTTRDASGYVDYTLTATSASVNKGNSYNLTVNIIGYQDGTSDEVYAWFDWNQDKDFEDAGEYMLLTKTSGTVGEISVNVPQDAVSGNTRMRIRVAYSPNSNVPCGSVGYGEVEDYTVNVGGSTPTNIAPIANITSPTEGTQFNAGSAITIEASASDSDGSVTKVEFFNGNTKLGEDASSPYSFTLNNASEGSLAFKVIATDDKGATTESTVVSVTVNATPNVAPTASITTPVGGAQFTVGSVITIEASASDSDGSVTKVEFFDGNTKLGEDASTPYSFIINNALEGNHSLKAIATDDKGATTESTVVSVTVTAGTTTIPDYCTANGTNGTEGITNVTFAGINKTSTRASTGYEDHTSSVGTVVVGSSHNLSVSIIGYREGVDDEVYVWFDWNRDGDFEDAGEYTMLTKPGELAETSITVPQDAVIGSIGMRIRVAYYNTNNIPCGTSSYGEVEDYTINVTDPANKGLSSLDSEKNSNTLTASPNPFKGGALNIDLQTSESGTAAIQLYNATGIKVFETTENKSSADSLIINISKELTAGLYILRVQLNDIVHSTRIIVE